MLAIALAAGSRQALAQQPTRLPAVVVNAAPDPPGPRKIAGIVRDTSAIPIDSVEVSIVSLQRRVYSKLDGTFLFGDIKPGTYTVRARKLGYAPQTKEMLVDSTGATGAFAMIPLPHVLRPVVTTVSKGGLSGVVGDTAFNALSGALVRVLGHEQFTTTDSLGSFHIPIQPGSYLVRISQEGFADRLVSAIIPRDSGQKIRVTLAPRSRPLPIREAHNVDDLASRLTWRSHAHSRVFTRAELLERKLEWVYDAVMIGYHEIHIGQPGMLDKDCVAMVNGGPDYAEIGKITVDDIETVEIYDMRSGAAAPATNTRRPPRPIPGQPIRRSQPAIEPVPITNTDRAAWANSTKTCTTVYVWLR